jgi:diaminohydroxyphosphoribosylaminopyrimidine deaminase/5-amino-6-(5-phosphoribosylamino)uracil reductase
MANEDSVFMRIAFSLARKADPFPNPRVGAVLVKDGKIIGNGYHRKPGMPHAEIIAIENAKHKTKNPLAVRGATLYVSLEPCSHTAKRTPPCVPAIIRSGIIRVVYGMKDLNPLVDGAGELMRSGVVVVGPTNDKEARAINRRYIANIRRKPTVAIKMAMSADGKTATRTGDSKWISGKESRELVHRMRSESDAVMVGAGTISHDNPSLTSHGKGKDPYRIIIDSDLHIPLRSNVVKNNHDRKTIIATSERAMKKTINAFERSGVMVFVCGESMVDLRKLVAGLSAMGMKKILVEGGNELNAKAVEAEIVDRLYLFIAPKIIGGRDAKPVIGGVGIARMSEAISLRKASVKRIGEDLLLEYWLKKTVKE